jgi:hypothetical protein
MLHEHLGTADSGAEVPLMMRKARKAFNSSDELIPSRFWLGRYSLFVPSPGVHFANTIFAMAKFRKSTDIPHCFGSGLNPKNRRSIARAKSILAVSRRAPIQFVQSWAQIALRTIWRAS